MFKRLKKAVSAVLILLMGLGVQAADVAKVGDTLYSSLTAAYTAASAGSTIELLTDVTENLTVNNTKVVTIDLATHTLTGNSGDLFNVTASAPLTIKNGSVVGNGGAVIYLGAANTALSFENVEMTLAALPRGSAVSIGNSKKGNTFAFHGGKILAEDSANGKMFDVPSSSALSVTIDGNAVLSSTRGPGSFGLSTSSSLKIESSTVNVTTMAKGDVIASIAGCIKSGISEVQAVTAYFDPAASKAKVEKGDSTYYLVGSQYIRNYLENLTVAEGETVVVEFTEIAEENETYTLPANVASFSNKSSQTIVINGESAEAGVDGYIDEVAKTRIYSLELYDKNGEKVGRYATFGNALADVADHYTAKLTRNMFVDGADGQVLIVGEDTSYLTIDGNGKTITARNFSFAENATVEAKSLFVVKDTIDCSFIDVTIDGQNLVNGVYAAGVWSDEGGLILDDVVFGNCAKDVVDNLSIVTLGEGTRVLTAEIYKNTAETTSSWYARTAEIDVDGAEVGTLTATGTEQEEVAVFVYAGSVENLVATAKALVYCEGGESNLALSDRAYASVGESGPATVGTLSLVSSALADVYTGSTVATFSSAAKIEGDGVARYYSSFTDALAEAVSGDTITLVADFTLEDTAGFVLDKDLTIDGADHTISAGNLTNEPAIFNTKGTANVVFKNLTLNMATGTYVQSRSPRAFDAGSGTTLTFDAVTVNGIANGYAIYPSDSSTVIVKNSVFNNVPYGIANAGGTGVTLSVTGSTFNTCTYPVLVTNASSGSITFTGNTVNAAEGTETSKINFVGGTVTMTGNKLKGGVRVKPQGAIKSATVVGNTLDDTSFIDLSSMSANSFAMCYANTGTTTATSTLTNTNANVIIYTFAPLTPDANGVYHIANKQDLETFRNMVNSGTSFSGKTVQLDAEIDLGNAAWTPIVGFSGTFNGNSKTVKNFTVTGEKDLGFFGSADGSTIKNLTIEKATVTGIGRVSALVGHGMCAKIENCTVRNSTLTATVVNNDDGDKVGAICGYLSGEPEAYAKNCTVENCTITGYRDVGGAVGIANVKAEVSNVAVTDTTVVNDKSINYKNYTTDAEYDVNQVVGETSSEATVTDNTPTNVTVTQPTMVAKVGINQYTTLEAAFAAATSGSTVDILSDVDLQGAAWTPIEISSVTVNGNGHKISNFTVTGEKAVGFFGHAPSSTIKDLTIENATVTGINSAAALVGHGLCTKIENCTVRNSTVTTSVANNDDGDKAGAICGYLSGENEAWVKNCTVENCTITGYRDVGGAVGIANVKAEVSNVTVKNTVVLCDQSNNYQNYTTDAEFNVNAVVGRTASAATIGKTTATVVSVGKVVDGLTPTTAGVWHITNLTGLKAYRDDVNSGKNYKDMTAQLDADIDLGGEAWTPIQTSFNQGVVFDGNGHKVSNFTVTGEKDLGFFGSADGSTIKNLTIEKATVTGIGRVSALAGHGMCAKIENCTVRNSTLTATVANNDDGDKVGAICAYLSAESTAWVKGCTVENCTLTGYRDIGGAVGIANGAAEVANVTVKDTTVVNERSINYKNYATDAEYDVNQIVGETTSYAIVSELTPDNVTVVMPTMVAKVGIYQYGSLVEALAAAKDGDTVTLLTSVSDGVGLIVPEGKFATDGLVIDLNGLTYAAASDPAGSSDTKRQVMQILKGNKVTILNGTLAVAEDSKSLFRMIIQNYSDLTLTGVTLDGTNLAFPNKTPYTLSNNCGNVVLGADTKVIAAANGIAFDTYKDPNYAMPTVTVAGATITGDVELGGGKLVLNTGSISGELKLEKAGVTGEVLKSAAFTENAPTDYAWTEAVDDYSTLGLAVAKIGTVFYETLPEAVDTANAGDTVTLVRDVQLTEALQIAKKMTLDLSTFTVTAADDCNAFELLAGCELTVNADATQPGHVVCGTGKRCIYTDNADFPGAKKIVINGGVYDGACEFNQWSSGHTGGQDAALNLVINGGTFNDEVTGFRLYHATVNGGTFEKRCEFGTTSTYCSSFKGGKFKVEPGSNNPGAIGIGDDSSKGIRIFDAVCFEDDGYFHVIKAADIPVDAVAKVGTTCYYMSIDDALSKAMTTGDDNRTTITLLKDADIDAKTVRTELMIDPNGHTLTGEPTIEEGHFFQTNGDGVYYVRNLLPGSGTLENPYEIVDQLSLEYFRDLVNGGNTFSGKYVVLVDDFTMTGDGWTTCIGNVTSYPSVTFSGTFDGQNHTIKGLKVTSTTPDYATAGLFGSIYGTVQNVKLEDVDISSSHYAGAIVGYSSAEGAKVINCHVDGGTITSVPELLNGEYDNGDKVGGIIGYSVDGDEISDCSVNNLTITAYRDVGGIAGASAGKLTNNSVSNTTVIESETNAYENEAFLTYNKILGRDLGATLSGNTDSNVTLNGPIGISTAAELVAFSAQVNAGNTYAGKKVVLTTNIDMANVAFTPIGNVVSYPGQTFAGLFDGQGYTISNLKVKSTTPEHATAGLFGSICGTVQNVKLTNVDITSSHYAGAIVGYTSAAEAKVINCSVDGGKITSVPEKLGNEYDNGDKVGGIFGHTVSGSEIRGCAVKNLTITAYRDVGGIVGYAAVGCSVAGNTVEDTTIYQSNVNEYKSGAILTYGEIVGKNDGATLTDNTDTRVTLYGSIEIGTPQELVAFAEKVNAGDAFENRKAVLINDIDMTDVAFTPIGASSKFKGVFEGNAKKISNLKVNASANYTGLFGGVFGATIKDLNLVDATVVNSGENYTGALVGGGYAKIENCTVTGGSVQGTDQVGGIIGYLSCGSIKNSTVSGVTIAATGDRAGGLTGKANVDSAYTITGNTVTGCAISAAKACDGLASAAGLVGQIMAAANHTWAITDNKILNTTTTTDADTTFVPVGEFRKGNYQADAVTAEHIARNYWEPLTTPNYYDLADVNTADTYVRVSNYIADPVASIGDSLYPTLAEAVAAAQEGETVTLLKNVDFGDYGASALTIPADKSLTLDLAGKQITGKTSATSSSYMIVNKGDLTITDSSEEGTGRILTGADSAWQYQGDGVFAGSYASSAIRNEGDLTIAGGTIENAGEGSACYAIDNYNAGNLAITGGKLQTAKSMTVRLYQSTGSARITGGELISGTRYAFQVMGGSAEVEISDGTFTSNNPDADDVYALTTYGAADASIAITGGTFNGDVWVDTEDIAISGGTFAYEVTEEYCADGFIPGYEPVEGYYGVSEGVFVVRNTTTGRGYTTLAEAVAVVPKDGTKTTLTMLVPYTVNQNAGVTVAKEQNIVLDLNGQTITQNAPDAAASAVINNNGTLEITDTTDAKAGKIELIPAQPQYSWSPSYASNVINNRGTLTVTAGSLVNTEEARQGALPASGCYVVDCYGGSTLTVNGGTLTSGYIPVRTYATSADGDIAVTVNDGTLNGMYCFYLQQASDANTKGKANVALAGGTFNSVDRDIVYAEAKVADLSTIAVSGGEFNYVEGRSTITMEGEAAQTVAVSGGTFASVVPEAYCADGFIPGYEPVEGYYRVSEGTFVVRNTTTGKGYTTLVEAVETVQNGETLELLASSEGAGVNVTLKDSAAKSFSIDFKGFTYTVNALPVGSPSTLTQAFHLEDIGATITLKGGTINVATEVANQIRLIVQDYGNLNIEGMTLDASNLALTTGTRTDTYALAVNAGTVTVTDSTLIGSGVSGITGYSLDADDHNLYGQATVTIEGETTLTGPISLEGGNLALNGLKEAGTIEFTSNWAGPDASTTVTKVATAEVTVPTGWAWLDGTKLAPTVAKIGDVAYASLANAVAAVPADGTETTITLIANSEITANKGVKTVAGQNIVLDLNGMTVSQVAPDAAASYLIENHGTLKVVDNTTEGAGKLTAKAEQPDAGYGYGNYTVENYGTFELASGTLEQTSTGAGAYYAVNAREGGTTTVSGGHVVASKIAVRQASFGTAENVLNITGGVIDSGYFAVETQVMGAYQNSKLNISGGTIRTSETTYNLAVYVQSTVDCPNVAATITGGTFDGDVAFTAKLPGENITVSNGTFNGEFGCYSYGQSGQFVTGGTFTGAEAAYTMNYLADGLALSGSEGSYTVNPGSVQLDFTETVAEESTDYSYCFISIDDALAYVEELLVSYEEADLTDFVVTLLKDVALTQPVDVTMPVTLDLNGKAVTTGEWAPTDAHDKDSLFTVCRGGALTIDDSSESMNGKIDATGCGTNASGVYKVYAAVKLTKAGESANGETASVVVKNGSVIGNYYGICGNGGRHDTAVTVSGGLVKGADELDSFGIYNPQNGSLTIDGGVVEGASGVCVKSGTVSVVTGGTVRATRTTAAPYKFSSNGVECTGDAFIIDSCGYPGEELSVAISGGMFESAAGKAVASYVKQDDTTKTGDFVRVEKFISGGFFSNVVDENYCAANYIPTYEDVDGYFTVVEGTFVARNMTTEKGYTTLAAAVAAAETDDTLDVLVAGTYKVPALSKNITIHGAVEGVVFDCTGAEQTSIASVPNGATFTNVTMNFGSTYLLGFQHAGPITFDACTLNGRLASYGPMVFTNCTLNAPGSKASGLSGTEYAMWVYGGDVTYENCVFYGTGKYINVYSEVRGTDATPYVVTVDSCTFKNEGEAKKAPILVKEWVDGSFEHYFTINVLGTNTLVGNFPEDCYEEDVTFAAGAGLVAVESGTRENGTGNVTININSETVYPLPVAKIGETMYCSMNKAFLDVNDQTEDDVVIEILRSSTEELTADYTLTKNVTLETSADGGVTVDLGFRYGKTLYALLANGTTLTIGDNVKILGLGQLFAGYGAANSVVDITGEVTAQQIWAYKGGEVNILPGSKVVATYGDGMIKLRCDSTFNVVGNGPETVQFAAGYFSGDYAGEKTLNLTDTAVTAEWLTNQGAGSFTLNLDNAKLTLNGKLDLSSDEAATGTINMTVDSLITAKSFAHIAALNIDASEVTAPVKVIDYTGTETMTLESFGTINVNGGVAYIEDNDLWIKRGEFFIYDDSFHGVSVKIPYSWIASEDGLGLSAVAPKDDINAALEVVQSNGLRVWQNMLLGLDGTDATGLNAAFARSSASTQTAPKICVNFKGQNKSKLPTWDTGVTVEYKLSVSTDAANWSLATDVTSTPDGVEMAMPTSSKALDTWYYKLDVDVEIKNN